jgi:chorismate dehydratase
MILDCSNGNRGAQLRLRIGSVPYLNAKPLVDWFHSPECDADVDIIYAVPSRLAEMLRAGEIDVCNCSIFESIRAPGLAIIPGISIASDGDVQSVRLFCRVPIEKVKTVALDASSLTSSAMTRIIVSDIYGISPYYRTTPPNLDNMLAECDAGLIIGDLKLFDLHEGTTVYDLGERWKALTGLPFVYAAWQALEDKVTAEMAAVLNTAKNWGTARLGELAEKWAVRLDLPIERCSGYFLNAMQYDLTERHIQGLKLFQEKCAAHGLVDEVVQLTFGAPNHGFGV